MANEIQYRKKTQSYLGIEPVCKLKSLIISVVYRRRGKAVVMSLIPSK